jgi:NAD(P)-dependent dehydrogenase (short-subunit alcohol dehydrogenase family)
MSLDTGKLTDKLCVVTGAAKSVGLDIAKRYLEYGAKVVLIDIDKNVEKTAEGLSQQGYRAEGIASNVTNRQEILKIFERIISEYGDIYALVNSAGIVDVRPFLEVTEDIWEKMFKVNVFGTAYCIQGVLENMKKNMEGRIINFSSKAGKEGSSLMACYGASKGAIITLTQALAKEFASFGIHVNCLCQDIIDETGVWETVRSRYVDTMNMSDREIVEMYTKKVPLGRFVKKEDVTDIVMFYTISGDDSTGQSINITGGRTMH